MFFSKKLTNFILILTLFHTFNDLITYIVPNIKLFKEQLKENIFAVIWWSLISNHSVANANHNLNFGFNTPTTCRRSLSCKYSFLWFLIDFFCFWDKCFVWNETKKKIYPAAIVVKCLKRVTVSQKRACFNADQIQSS